MLPAPTVVVKDSIVEKETLIVKSDTVYTPGQKVFLIKTLPCLDAKFDTTIKSGNTTLKASMKDGHLEASCAADSLTRIIDSLTRVKQKEHFHTETIYVPTEVIKYKVPKWCWWLVAICMGCIAWQFRYPLLKLFA
jgi:hypothetical protein